MICPKCKYYWVELEDKPLGNCPSCGENPIKALISNITNLRVENILRIILRVYGNELLENKHKLKALIDDLFHQDDRNKRLIQIAVQHEIPYKLFTLYQQGSHDLTIQVLSLRKQVQDLTFLSDSAIKEMFQILIRTFRPFSANSTKTDNEDGEWLDEFEVKYSEDRRKLIKSSMREKHYEVIDGTEVICDEAFENCKNLISVIIPDSVNFIGNSAFKNCENLISVIIPDSVNFIGDSAFEACERIKEINIPFSVSSIRNSTFAHCRDLTNITLPSSITSIGNSAFYDCFDLTKLTIPCTVLDIGEYAFSHCLNLKSITIPHSVRSIGANAFYYNINLTKIKVEKANLKYCSVDGVLFDSNKRTIICYPYGKGKLEKKYNIPDSVTTIGDNAFNYCNELTSISIPASVTNIGKKAFSGCNKLTEIQIPNSITSIGAGAFSHCYFKGIIIPNTVTSIGPEAFHECIYLSTIRIPPSVTKIEDSTFRCCFSLSSVTLPPTIISIGNEAFLGCERLKYFWFYPKVKLDEDKTWLDSYIPSQFNLPPSVSSIGCEAFKDCVSLNSYNPSGGFVIPPKVTEIHYGAFWGCSNFKIITILSSMIEIGESVFQDHNNYGPKEIRIKRGNQKLKEILSEAGYQRYIVEI